MKSFRLISAGLLAATAIGVAHADVNLKITGSSAYRKALYAAIVDQLGSGTVKAAYIGSALNGANQAVFTVGASPNKTTIECCIAGSVGGVNWVANGLTVATDKDRTDPAHAWLAESNATAVATVSGGQATGGNAVTFAGATWEGASVAKVTMSDSYQDSTQWNSLNYPALTEEGASSGVVQFVFAKGKLYGGVSSDSYNRFTNVTPLAFQYLASSGFAPLAMFTGNSADQGVDVVLVGRDNDSGTRLGCFYETAYGTDTTTAVQYRAYDASSIDVGSGTGATAIASLLSAGDGFAGYSSGGQVKAVLSASDTGSVRSPRDGTTPVIVLGYVSTADAPIAGQILSYNGVAQTDAATQLGQYTFWTNEHMYWKGLTGAVGTAGTERFTIRQIQTKIRNTYATSAAGLLGSSMQAARPSEGLPVTPNYP